jgi:hypothetical protein
MIQIKYDGLGELQHIFKFLKVSVNENEEYVILQNSYGECCIKKENIPIKTNPLEFDNFVSYLNKYTLDMQIIKKKLVLESIGYFIRIDDIQIIVGNKMRALILHGYSNTILDHEISNYKKKLVAVLPPIDNSVTVWEIESICKMPNQSRIFNCKYQRSINLL